jgi:hypothetical protein
LVMSSVRKNQTPLSYALKCSWLIGVIEGNENYKSLIALEHVSRLIITLLVLVVFH